MSTYAITILAAGIGVPVLATSQRIIINGRWCGSYQRA